MKQIIALMLIAGSSLASNITFSGFVDPLGNPTNHMVALSLLSPVNNAGTVAFGPIPPLAMRDFTGTLSNVVAGTFLANIAGFGRPLFLVVPNDDRNYFYLQLVTNPPPNVFNITFPADASRYTNGNASHFFSSGVVPLDFLPAILLTNGLATTNWVGENYALEAEMQTVVQYESGVVLGQPFWQIFDPTATMVLFGSGDRSWLTTSEALLQATNNSNGVLGSYDGSLLTSLNASQLEGPMPPAYTNGLATTNYVTGQGYVTAAITNGLVGAGVTNGLATTNYVAVVSANVFLTGDQLSFPIATNLFFATNVPAPDTLGAGLYGLAGTFTNNQFGGEYWTNFNGSGYCLEDIFNSGNHSGFQLVAVVNGSGHQSSYLDRYHADIQSVAGVYPTNAPLAIWGDASTPAHIATGFKVLAVQNTAVFQVPPAIVLLGDGASITNLSLHYPADDEYNANAALVPQIYNTTWANVNGFGGRADQYITNEWQFITASNILLDGELLDINYGFAGRATSGPTNGQLYLDAINFVGTQTNFIAYMHAMGKKVTCWATIWPTSITEGQGSGVYDGSTAAHLFNDLIQMRGWGYDGAALDHYGNLASDRDYQKVRNSQAATAFTEFLLTIESCTNLAANGTVAANPKPFSLDWYSGSRDTWGENAANSYCDGGDLFIGGNGHPQGPFSAWQAETNYEATIAYYTNRSAWVRPGHVVNALGITPDAGSADITNQINLCAMEAFSVKTLGIYYPGSGAAPGQTAFTNAVNQCLKNSEVVYGIWKDRLVKMALPILRFTNADGSWSEVYSKPISPENQYAAGAQYALMLWNHSGTNTYTISFTPSQVNQTWSNSPVIVRNPWTHAVYTNTAGAITLSTPATNGQTQLLTVQLAPGQVGVSISGDLSGGTNLPASGISTIGSAAGQTLVNIGGQTMWTNTVAVLTTTGITNNGSITNTGNGLVNGSVGIGGALTTGGAVNVGTGVAGQNLNIINGAVKFPGNVTSIGGVTSVLATLSITNGISALAGTFTNSVSAYVFAALTNNPAPTFSVLNGSMLVFPTNVIPSDTRMEVAFVSTNTGTFRQKFHVTFGTVLPLVPVVICGPANDSMVANFSGDNIGAANKTTNGFDVECNGSGSNGTVAVIDIWVIL